MDNLEPSMDDVALDKIFGKRLLIPMAEAAHALAMDVRTLREHAQRGEIVFTQVGRGSDRIKRCFTRSQLLAFLAQGEKQDRPAPLSKGQALAVDAILRKRGAGSRDFIR
ncbi:helix-turn-helix domain-containing protein [Devosia aurantiaca]|uniref:Helix-turn-helix domain-containing protein n=1 Tax=Devosia aurantiaca TaxID=2714858 RepID=A0A6M1S927_9HYPH|nr:helix-turn-helix domain-containing protein [Devosia aurantiaca]NGP16519.1 helix-turn-helix domain-containing protein [Devosia aurantiaca]